MGMSRVNGRKRRPAGWGPARLGPQPGLGLLPWAAVVLLLTALLAGGCGRRPTPYEQQLSRAVEAGVRGQELFSEGQTRRAERSFSRSLELHAGLDDPAGMAKQLNNLGAAAAAREDLDRAAAYFRQALFFNEQQGDSAAAALNLANLAALADKTGDRRQAAQYLQEALTKARLSRSPQVLGQVLCQAAGAALSENDLSTAAALLAEAAPASSHPGVRGPWNYQQGRLQLARGDLPLARNYFHQALAADRAILNRLGLGADLQGLADVEERQGDLGPGLSLRQPGLSPLSG
jgi:tetratricopeptide (TPR) repeat protein